MRRVQAPVCGVRLVGLVLAVAGYLGPWVPHKTAALAVTGLELAEFAKFFPQVQGGVVPVMRALFYCPFVVALVLLVFFSSRSTARLGRLIISVLAVALLLVVLLPYFVIDGVRHALVTRSAFSVDPQYARQLALLIVGMTLVLCIPLAHRFTQRVQGILVVLLALGGAVPALWQFTLLHPLVVALYGSSLGLGWGLVACVVGFALLLLSGVLDIARFWLTVHSLPPDV
jgi:hypothetical protein